MAKELGIQKIEMFEKMVRTEFDPVLTTLRSRTYRIRAAIEKRVKADLGYYELIAKIKAKELELTELNAEVRNLEVEPGYSGYHSGGYRANSPIGIEVTKRLTQLDGTADRVEKLQAAAIKRLRLCGVAEDVSNLFSNIEESLLAVAKDIKKLPPITKVLKQIKK